MANVVQGYKNVQAISGARVVDSQGRTVVVQFPSGRSYTEKPFVGEKSTRSPKQLTDWLKGKKPF